MANGVFLTYSDGSPVVGVIVAVTGFAGTANGNPFTTSSEGYFFVTVTAPGTYNLVTTVNGVQYSNTMIFDAVGAAPDLHWHLSQPDAIERPPYGALLMVGAIVAFIGVAYWKHWI